MKTGIVQGDPHLFYFKLQALPHRFVYASLALNDLDDCFLVWRKTETMNPIFGLKVLSGIEISIQIDRVMANCMKADSLASCRRIRDHRHYGGVVVKETYFSFACVVVAFIASVYTAVNVDSLLISTQN